METWPRIWLPIVVSVALATIILSSDIYGSSIQRVLVIAFLAVGPGMMVVRLAGVKFEWVSELSAAVVMSLALNGIVAGIGLYAGVWEPKLFAVIMGAFTLFLAAILVLRDQVDLELWRGASDDGDSGQHSPDIAETGKGRASEALPSPVEDRSSAARASLRPAGADIDRLVLEDLLLEVSFLTESAEGARLRERVERLESELAGYRQHLEWLSAQVARYGELDDLRDRLLISASRHARAADDARRESEAILEHAQARLATALARMRAGETRDDRSRSRPPRGSERS